MMQTQFPTLSIVVILWLVHGAATQDNSFVTAEDIEVQNDAQAAVDKFCTDAEKVKLNVDAARQSLTDAVGGDNVLLTSLQESSNAEEMIDILISKISPGWVINQSVPLGLAVVMVIAWTVCCWSACPCCKCCRCCQKRAPQSIITKIILIVGLLILLGGLGACFGFAVKGWNKFSSGVDRLACTSAQLLDTVYSGQASPYFIGILPLLNEFGELETKLDENSEFMTELRRIIASTQTITNAVTVASQTLRLLRDMMNEPANKSPSDDSRNPPEDLLHDCVFCDSLPGLLTPAIDELDNGVGSELAKARDEVDQQLNDPANRDTLKGNLDKTQEPLSGVKDVLRTALGGLVDEQFGGLIEQTESTSSMLAGSLAVPILVTLVVLLGCCTFCCWIGREKSGVAQAGGEQKHAAAVYRCALCSWCCGFWVAFLGFLLGGIYLFASVPLSGVCLIFDDLDKERVLDLSSITGLDPNNPDEEMTIDIISQCFGKNAATNNPYLLDLITIEENGERVTMRAKVVNEVKDAIETQFNQVREKIASLPSLSLADSTEVQDLRRAIRGHPMDQMIIATRVRDDSTFEDMEGTALAVGFTTSVACADGSISANLTQGNEESVPGIDTFFASLDDMGTATGGVSDCWDKQVNCNSGADQNACVAGNQYMLLKQRFYEITNFRCDIFENDDGTDCDVKDMELVGGTWNGDCLRSDGNMLVKQKTCDLLNFKEYIEDYDTRIDLAFERLDAAVTEVKDTIDEDLRNLVNSAVVTPIEKVANGVTCGFLGESFSNLVEGLCFRSVYGLRIIGWSWVAAGGIAVLFTMLMYGVWRRAVDNSNLWTQGEQSQKAEDCFVGSI